MALPRLLSRRDADTTQAARTWRDFPDFVREVDRLEELRQLHRQNQTSLNDAQVGFLANKSNDVADRISAAAQALVSGSTAVAAVEKPTLVALAEAVKVSEAVVSLQAWKVKEIHGVVRREIGNDRLAECKTIVMRNRDALLEHLAAVRELRQFRTDVLMATGDDREFSRRMALVGGVGEPSHMPLPLFTGSFTSDENHFLRMANAMTEVFTTSVNLYLENNV